MFGLIKNDIRFMFVMLLLLHSPITAPEVCWPNPSKKRSKSDLNDLPIHFFDVWTVLLLYGQSTTHNTLCYKYS